MILYNIRRSNHAYLIAKFDDDFNVESAYELTENECSCPAGSRKSCRHRQMLPVFLAANAVDTEQFYCFETSSWVKPDLNHIDEHSDLAALQRALEPGVADLSVYDTQPEEVVDELTQPAPAPAPVVVSPQAAGAIRRRV
jgi:hypothetical protein